MALGLRDRLRMGAGSIEEWLRDREADLGRGLADAEVKGREIYAHAVRNKQDVAARTTSELRDLGKRFPTRDRAPPPSTRGPNWDEQILANAHRLETDAAAKAKVMLRQGVDQAARKVAGDTALTAGNVAGAVTGAVHLGHNIVDSAVLAERLQNPILDYILSAPGQSANDELIGIELGTYGLAKRVATQPLSAAHDVAQQVRHLERDTDPLATPEAPTPSGEARRKFYIGKRQGEIGAEIAPYFVGAGEIKGMADLGALARANNVGKYADMGFSKAKAARLAQPYSGMGDHAFFRRGAQIPAWLGGGRVPEWIVESPFNVLKPGGISTGDMYELHFKVDPQMYGARLPGGGPGWSGRRLGLQKYEGPMRLWYRTPNATKQAVAVGGAIGTVPLHGDEAE